MVGRFPYLWVFSKKLLEIVGAGLASALVAGLLGQTDKAAPVSAPSLAPVVYLAPEDAQMITLMHNEQAALLQRLRNQPVTPATDPVAPAETPAAPQPAAAAPVAPSIPVVSARRESKPHRATAAVAAKQQPPAETSTAAALITAGSANRIEVASSPTVTPTVAAAPAVQEPKIVPALVEEAVGWFTTLPGRVWSAGGGLSSEAPRPPVPVGNFFSHVM